jgi:hypothetical protein
MANGSQLMTWAINMMKQWSLEDPVSPKETDRNNAVYAIQNNRNPFIDHPEYINGIWGTGMGISESGKSNLLLEISPNPAGDRCSVSVPGQLMSDQPLICIFTITGERVEVPVAWNGPIAEISIRTIPSGIYFVTVSGTRNGWIYHGKIIRQ